MKQHAQDLFLRDDVVHAPAGEGEGLPLVAYAAGVLEKVADRDLVAVVRQLRQVLADVVLDRQFAFLFKEDQRHRGELLGNRRHMKYGVGRNEHVVLEIGGPVAFLVGELSVFYDSDRRAGRVEIVPGLENAVDAGSGVVLCAKGCAGGYQNECEAVQHWLPFDGPSGGGSAHVIVIDRGNTMGQSLLIYISLVLMAGIGLAAEDYPEAEISNGIVRAKLHLPDVERGSYRGTRFDWAGIIYSLQYEGHEYFGRWYERHDPKIHDAITGPVEEFVLNNSALGYEAAKPGGSFVRIGVGVLRKPENETAFKRFGTYEIVDPGKRTINKKADSIEFVQELKGPDGYSYVYRKTVRLVKGKPELVLEHSLKNTGQKAIETSVYNHNFFVIDNEVVGPDVVIQYSFEPKAPVDLKGLAWIRGHDFVYRRELEKGQTVQSEIEGFGETAKDYDLRIENRKSGAGVRIGGGGAIEEKKFLVILAGAGSG